MSVSVTVPTFLTKSDLADSAGIGTLMTAIRDVNPACEITLNDVPEAIFAPVESGIIDSPRRAANTPLHLHTGTVRSFSTVLDRSIDWATFSVWLTALLNRHGGHILRFKSVLAVRSSGKLVAQGMRHRVYPPSHLPAEDNEDNVSRLVFIENGISEQRILDSLEQFYYSDVLIQQVLSCSLVDLSPATGNPACLPDTKVSRWRCGGFFANPGHPEIRFLS